MSQRIICHEYHYVVSGEVEFIYSNKFVHQYAGACKKCDKTLSFSPFTVEIKSVNK